MDSVIKAAKKILKKSSDPLNLKDVLKKVAKKVDGNATSDEIEKWINGSDKFTIDGKTISLSKSKKRKSDDVDDKAAKKAAKKAKQQAALGSAGTAGAAGAAGALGSGVDIIAETKKLEEKMGKDASGKSPCYFHHTPGKKCRFDADKCQRYH